MTMKRKHLDFKNFLEDSLKNPAVKREYDKLRPEFEMVNNIIKARVKVGLTQEKLAERIGTKQSVISRLESGRSNPSLSFLKKLSEALNTRLEIKFHNLSR